MTGRSFALSTITVAVVAAIAGRYSATDPAPLPARVQARLERHTTQMVIDSAETQRLRGVAQQLRTQLQEQVSIAVRAEASAMWARVKADSLRAAVDTARTAADSARTWEAAYTARSIEADSLLAANAGKDSALAIAAHERTVADSAYLIMAGHAARSDTLVAELLPLAQRRDRCRVGWLIPCPTRKQAAIVGALTGAAAVAIVTGKIKVRLPIG